MFIFKKIPDELDAFEGDFVLAVVGEEEKPLRAANAWIDWRLFGSITELQARGLFQAKLGEKFLLPTYGRFSFDRVVLLGGGRLFDYEGVPSSERGQDKWHQIFEEIHTTTSSLKAYRVGLSLPRYESMDQEKKLVELLKASPVDNTTSLFLSRASEHFTPLGF